MTDLAAPTLHPVLTELASLYGPGGGGTVAAWIDGAPVAGEGAPIPLTDPATGLGILRYADAGAPMAARAARGAAAAQAGWAALSGADRRRALLGWADAVRGAADGLIRLEAGNTGKPVQACRAELSLMLETIEYHADWADKQEGRLIALPLGRAGITRDPFGVVLSIASATAPMLSAVWTAAPALAAGNAVIVKPPEASPLSALVLGLLACEGGLPRGLLQVVPGASQTTGVALVSEPAVRQVVFTGAARTGAQVARICAERLKPCLLQLDGQSANIVFADAEFDAAADAARLAAFAGHGSRTAGTRLLVQHALFERLTMRVAEAASRMRVGMPLDEATELGPVGSRQAWQAAQDVLAESAAAGAWIARRPTPPHLPGGGNWVMPTVLAQLTEGAAVLRDPLAAPLLAVIPFEDEAEAVRIANGGRYGPAGAVWTGDQARARRVAAALRAGTVWINGYGVLHPSMPFAGVDGSGHGGCSGRESVEAFTRTRTVWSDAGAPVPVPAHGAP